MENGDHTYEGAEQPLLGHRRRGSSTCSPGIASSQQSSRLMALLSSPWAQILLISLICFCMPGSFNSLSGLGGSGQLDESVAANANVALLAAAAVTALFIAGPVFSWLGPRTCLLLGGWTYALYSGSLLNFNHTSNGAAVVASGAILGVGSSFLWVVQGAIMTTYVDETQKGRAIAVFWIIFNFGGGIGALISFALNYDSENGSVSDSTYIALMSVMLFGWLLSVFICSPSQIQFRKSPKPTENKTSSFRAMFHHAVETISTWRVVCMMPLFFCANIFYSYQQNNVNGLTFNIRTRSLNSALYWFAQMLGGLFMGLILDLPSLNRPARAYLGWLILFASGMVIWAAGYKFQVWQDEYFADGHRQDIDYLDTKLSIGPIILYIFYGAYDALWQSFAYWLLGTESNDASRSAIMVGLYKSLTAVGGCLGWRVNALGKSGMLQLAMNWGLCVGSLLVVLPAVRTVSETTEEEVCATE